MSVTFQDSQCSWFHNIWEKGKRIREGPSEEVAPEMGLKGQPTFRLQLGMEDFKCDRPREEAEVPKCLVCLGSDDVLHSGHCMG